MEPITWNQRNFCEVAKYKGDFNNENPYYLRRTISAGNHPPRMDPNSLRPSFLLSFNDLNKIHNKLVKKASEDLTPISNYFEAIYERQEAYNMLIDAGKGILEFATNWRKPKYWKKIAGKLKQPTSLPEAWITYQFGIQPLVLTVNDSLNMLGKNFPTEKIQYSSGKPISWYDDSSDDSRLDVRVEKGTYVKQLRVRFKPNTNPNAALLNAVGLTTPFSTAWSVIPWGWAVDYFVNVSDLLSNFECRFPGITVDSVWETEFIKLSGNGTWVERSKIGPWWSTDYEYYEFTRRSYASESLYLRRSSSDLKYRVEFNYPNIGDNQAANLFSALALTLKGKN